MLLASSQELALNSALNPTSAGRRAHRQGEGARGIAAALNHRHSFSKPSSDPACAGRRGHGEGARGIAAALNHRTLFNL